MRQETHLYFATVGLARPLVVNGEQSPQHDVPTVVEVLARGAQGGDQEPQPRHLPYQEHSVQTLIKSVTRPVPISA